MIKRIKILIELRFSQDFYDHVEVYNISIYPYNTLTYIYNFDTILNTLYIDDKLVSKKLNIILI